MNYNYVKCKICDNVNSNTCQHILTTNYNYKKVWKYNKLFQQIQENSQQYLKLQIQQHLTQQEQELITHLTLQEQKQFTPPSVLQIQIKTQEEEEKQIPELYMLIMEHDVQLRERNGFMQTLTQHIQKQKNPIYQNTFGTYIQTYTRNRLMNILPIHEQWKTKHPQLYTEIEDYMRAYIITQILLQEEEITQI